MSWMQTAIPRTFCPFSRTNCDEHCVLLLQHEPIDVEHVAMHDGAEFVCSIAVIASRMASETHAGGNYYMRTFVASCDNDA